MIPAFLSDDELTAWTGCMSKPARIHWLKANDIPFRVSPKHGIIVARIHRSLARPGLLGMLDTQRIRIAESMPRRGAGLYFLFEGDEIVYVGVTTNFFVRMAAHDKSGIDFDSARFLPMPIEEARLIEREFILHHGPAHNVQWGVPLQPTDPFLKTILP